MVRFRFPIYRINCFGPGATAQPVSMAPGVPKVEAMTTLGTDGFRLALDPARVLYDSSHSVQASTF
jgi:hypothetical protein